MRLLAFDSIYKKDKINLPGYPTPAPTTPTFTPTPPNPKPIPRVFLADDSEFSNEDFGASASINSKSFFCTDSGNGTATTATRKHVTTIIKFIILKLDNIFICLKRSRKMVKNEQYLIKEKQNYLLF